MKTKKFIITFLAIIVIAGVLVWTIKPLFKNLNYGLDLKGGFEVLYKVKPMEGEELTFQMVQSTYKIIENRIDILGVSEPEISVEGTDNIRVRLAGITDEKEARELMSKPVNLTFRDTFNNLLMTSEVLDGAQLSNHNGLPAVALKIKDNQLLYDVTNKVKDYADDRMVIWLDFRQGLDDFKKEEALCGQFDKSKCLSAPSLNKQAYTGDVVITGAFTFEEASRLAELINSGSFTTELEELSSRTVEASLGEQSLEKTLTAGIIGILAIIIMMSLVYRFAGFISGISILIYTLLVFVIFYLIGGVLTLPGLAALVLGIGMAIDSCVITYERIKEELYLKKPLLQAYRLGNKQSLSSIIDANITTLIVAIILFFFGQGSIKGFATMLIVNIFVTVIAMIVINKSLLYLFIKTGFFNNKTGFFISLKKDKIKKDKVIKNTPFNFNFIFSYKKYLISTLLVFVVGIIINVFTGFNFGIDFAGGSNITITTNNMITEEQIKAELNTLGYKIDRLESYDYVVDVKIKDILDKEKSEIITNAFNEKYQVKADVAVVSNIVKQDLIKNAIISLILSFVGIIIYVSLRFRFSYAISAVVALVHDALAMIILFGILKIEINTIFIAALLTIIGYSINDTIVSFDRIRENFRKKHNRYINDEEELKTLVNDSLNQTLTRTILTFITTLIPVTCLILFGSYEIVNFNIALLIGLIFGTYSSLFVAAQLWTMIEIKKISDRKKGKIKKEKKQLVEAEELIVKGVND